MSTEYEHLDLDDLLIMSRTDAEYAGDMAEQARVLREMSETLQHKVDLMRTAMDTLFGGDASAPESGPGAWQGASSDMMRTEIDRLYRMAEKAPEVLESNAASMDDFAGRTQDTLSKIDNLHVSSNGGQSGAAEARRVMQDASSGYLATAESMGEPEFYNGLRKDAPDEPQGDWTQRHGNASGGWAPEPQQPGAPAQPVDGAPSGQTHEPRQPAPTGGPTLQSSGPTGAPTGAPAPAPAAPAPGPMPVTPPAPVPTGGQPWTVSPDRTVRPVIGGRPTATPNGTPPRPVTQPGGTVRPVIGTRPNTGGYGAPARPVTQPGTTVRPVIGTRPNTGGFGGPRSAPGSGGTLPPPTGGRGGAGPTRMTSEGTVRPVIGGRGGMAPYAPSSRPAANPNATARPMAGGAGSASGRAPFPTGDRPVSGRLAVDPRTISATGQRIAKPETGEKAAANRAAAVKAANRKRSGKRPAGQRVRRAVRQDGPVLERAINRGARQRSESPGQEVFAKFAQRQAREESKRAPEPDADSVWNVAQPVVPSVIGGRRDSRFGDARS